MLVSSLRRLASAFRDREARILMLGLDSAGKTTVLYRLQQNEAVQTIPTVGFNVETVKYRNISFVVWDVGGQDKLRSLWRHYFAGVDALIYVVDASDTARIDEARDELHRLMADAALSSVTLLVFGNKQDLPGALSEEALVRRLELPKLTRTWHCRGTVATQGVGLVEGLDWLAGNLPPPS